MKQTQISAKKHQSNIAPKHFLHRLAIAAEKLVDRVRRTDRKERPIGIEPYIGWNEDNDVLLRGRVLATRERIDPVAGQGIWTNFKQKAVLFLTDEVADVPVSSGDVTVSTDEEGYFLLRRRGSATSPGWNSLPVEIAEREGTRIAAPVWVTPPDAGFIVVSDVDDTVLVTGAYTLLRNLWTTLTGNALTRKVFEDASPFLEMLHDKGRNPVFYVSSSPWNLHAFLLEVFKRNGVPRGPLFLRDLGISEKKFIKSSHGGHKGAAIDTVLSAHSELPVVLVGDTGQHDAEVYHEVSERWPGRIAAVVLRDAARDSAEADSGVRKLEAAGIPVYLTGDFMQVAEDLRSKLPLQAA